MPPKKVIPPIRSAPESARTLSTEEIRTIRALPYENYLYSTWWFSRRNKALRDAGYHCQRCNVKRELRVHHLSYDRLGAELDSDLEVLCRGCHLGLHVNRAQAGVGLYARVISDVLANGRLNELPDIVEEAKARCIALHIPYNHEQFHIALARLVPRFPRPQTSENNRELYRVGAATEPLSRAEAAAVIASLGAANLMKHMPQVRPLTVRQIECHRAACLVAHGIVEQIQRCEDAEEAKR
jgi:hypothetical protein